MLKNLILRTVLCHAVVDWLLVTEIMSQSYKGNYDGYVFTSPGFSAYRTSNDAQTLCAQNGSNLLEIKSSYVQNLTLQFLRDTGIQFADGTFLITNGIRNDVDWRWVNGQGRIAGTFDCTNGFSQNQRCFTKYSSPTMSWFDARNQCLNEGGDLASFDFINDDQELNSTLRGSWLNSSATYWVGLRRQLWTWQISKLEVNYTNWANGRPVYPEGGGNRCLCIYKSGADWKWIECNCNSPFLFVCLTEPPNTPVDSTTRTQVISAISTTKTTTSSGFRSGTNIFSITSTVPPPLFTSTWLDSTDVRVLAVGLGIGIPALLIILVLSTGMALMKKKLSSQTRLLANTGKYVGAVAHTESPVRRNPENGVNESLEMVSHQSTSPYESLQQEGKAINDRHYQELQIPNRREANGPETSDYEPVRRY